MSLTTDDLISIKQLVGDSIDEHVPRVVQPMLNKLEEKLTAKLDSLEKITNGAFDDTQAQINTLQSYMNGVKETVQRIERVLLVERDRNDRQDLSNKRIRKSLRAA